MKYLTNLVLAAKKAVSDKCSILSNKFRSVKETLVTRTSSLYCQALSKWAKAKTTRTYRVLSTIAHWFEKAAAAYHCYHFAEVLIRTLWKLTQFIV